jgi:hypothetical protein
MSETRTAEEILEQCHLEIRCKLIEIAASLDRIERSDKADAVCDDPRLTQYQDSLQVLAGAGFDRAEKLQMIFSDDYIPNWNR